MELTRGLETFALLFFATGTLVFAEVIILSVIWLIAYLKPDNGRHVRDSLYDNDEDERLSTTDPNLRRPKPSESKLADLVRRQTPEPTVYHVERVDGPPTQDFKVPRNWLDPDDAHFFQED